VREQLRDWYTRREFMIYEAVMAGADLMTAVEAAASTAIEHPEWDMDEAMTWQQWEKDRNR
jgi:hypothetical protein